MIARPFELYRFDFYPADWILSRRTRTMTLAQRGAYIDLLVYSARVGPLPNDHAALASMLGITAAEFATIWCEPLASCWIDAGGSMILNPRLEHERSQAASRSAKRSAAGRAANEARWHAAASSPCTPTTQNQNSENDKAIGSNSDPIRTKRPVWEAVCEEVIGLDSPELAAWMAACADRAAGRRDWSHTPLKPPGWKRTLNTWKPRGLEAFQAAVRHTNEHPWEGLFAPKGGHAAAPAAGTSPAEAWAEVLEQRKRLEAWRSEKRRVEWKGVEVAPFEPKWSSARVEHAATSVNWRGDWSGTPESITRAQFERYYAQFAAKPTAMGA